MFLFLFIPHCFCLFFNECSILGETPSKRENLEGLVKMLTLYDLKMYSKNYGVRKRSVYSSLVGYPSRGRPRAPCQGQERKEHMTGMFTLGAFIATCCFSGISPFRIEGSFIYCNSGTNTSSNNSTVCNCWGRGFAKSH